MNFIMGMVPEVPKVNNLLCIKYPMGKISQGIRGKLRNLANSVHENKLQGCHRQYLIEI